VTPPTAFRLARWGCLAAVLLVCLAMLAYPGGTFIDSTTDGYSVLGNSLSDLGMLVAWSGQPNRLAAIMLMVGILALALSGMVFAVFLIRLHVSSQSGQLLANCARLAGLIAFICLLGAGVIPLDRLPSFHGTMTLIAHVAAVVATLLLAVLCGRDWRFPRLAVGAWLFLTVVIVTFLAVTQLLPMPTTEKAQALPVAVQKLLGVSLVVVIAYQSYIAEGVFWNAQRETA